MSDEENQQMAPGLIQAFNPEEAEDIPTVNAADSAFNSWLISCNALYVNTSAAISYTSVIAVTKF